MCDCLSVFVDEIHTARCWDTDQPRNYIFCVGDLGDRKRISGNHTYEWAGRWKGADTRREKKGVGGVSGTGKTKQNKNTKNPPTTNQKK